jgi:hypothetical protein
MDVPGSGPEQPIHIDAEDARAGDIILRRRWQRWVFVGGLVGIAVLFLMLFAVLG